MIRTLSLVLVGIAVTPPVFAAASVTAKPDLRSAPLMGVPVMTGLSRVRLPVAAIASPAVSVRPATAAVRDDDVVATARKTLSGNEEIISPQP